MNGGKDIKFGDDERQISIVPNDTVNLYNISNGELLIDEFGEPLLTETDIFYLPDASSAKSTSVVFNSQDDIYFRTEYEDVGIATATYGNLSNVLTVDSYSGNTILVGDIVFGPEIPDGTIVSRISNNDYFLSNNVANLQSRTNQILIQRSKNEIKRSDVVWKIEEQFKETSEVSTTLLGVNRAELQLSLFSNVSSYGLDPDEFEFYSFNSGNSFGSWENRRNKIYGNRYSATTTEEIQESSIKLAAFPTPYSYPYGPKFQRVGLYNQDLFNRYINFIQLGNDLYDYFNTGAGSSYPSDWKEQFLPSEITSVSSGDVQYTAGITESFYRIDVWTDTWRDIKDSLLIDPLSGEKFTFATVSTILGATYDSTNTRPGYSTNQQRYGYLQSRRVFRYQPGRISGFTFGLRSSIEPTTGIVLEWGISNFTDQYVFRVDAGQFSIVRRSTVPLEQSVIERNGLNFEDQINVGSGDPFDSKTYWTLNIPRDKFNGDPLNSNGPSGYLLDPSKVTMYKIEFGWYGAIGARFYAYIPIDNGESRWVVIHTLVIENSLGQPCLRDSYFRLKYSLNIRDTGDVRTPQFLYKYGASYYIDGGDDATSQIYSVSSNQKTISSTKQKSLIGIRAKDFIFNSNGVPIQNKKLIIPTELNISTDSLTEVKIVTCSACPGFGHVYTPGIASTESGKYVDVEFIDQNTITAINDSYFTLDDVGSKIIAPSIYNAYISSVSDSGDIAGSFLNASIKGFSGTSGFNLVDRNIGESSALDRVTGISTIIGIGTYPYPIRLSNYNSYAASDFKFTGSKMEIQFVNPNKSDAYAHFSDFLIGITDKTPDVSLPDTLNGFIVSGITTTVLDNTEILYGEHTHTYSSINEDGVDTGEAWGTNTPPLKMGIDYRIPKIPNPAGGICSKVIITVDEPLEIYDLNVSTVNPETNVNDGNVYIVKTGNLPSLDYDGGEIAILDANENVVVTGSRFIGKVKTYSNQNIISSYIRISQTLGNVGSNFTALIRPITINVSGEGSKSKLYNYDPYPLYLVTKLRDYAEINNISVVETIGDFTRTISPKWYVNENATVTNVSGNAEINGASPTNFEEISRLSSASIDTQNEQVLRPFTVRDTFYVGSNSTQTVSLNKVFGSDKRVITPDNNNVEATFILAKKIDSGDTGVIESSLNFKEQ